MPYTALAQTPDVPDAFDGTDIFAAAENPDIVNGNTVAHSNKRALFVRNNHATEYVTIQPIVQATVREDANNSLAVVDPDPIQVDAGQVKMIGPLSAANFKKAADALMYFDWALEAGTIAAEDIDVAVVDM